MSQCSHCKACHAANCRLPPMHCLSARVSGVLWSPPRASRTCCTLAIKPGLASSTWRSSCKTCCMRLWSKLMNRSVLTGDIFLEDVSSHSRVVEKSMPIDDSSQFISVWTQRQSLFEGYLNGVLLVLHCSLRLYCAYCVWVICSQAVAGLVDLFGFGCVHSI